MPMKRCLSSMCELNRSHQVAALIIAQESFRTRRGEFHRPSKSLRGPQHQTEFDIGPIARAEIAADIGGDHPQPFGRHTDDLDQLVLLPHRAAGAGIKNIAVGLRKVLRDRRARLHRHAGNAADDEFLFDDMRRAGERAIGRLLIAEKSFDGHVVGHFVPYRRRSRLQSVFRMQHERQHVVLHIDRFSGIHRLRFGLGDHHDDGLADMPHFVDRQQRMRAGKNRPAARPGQLLVEFGLRHRIVRNGADLVGSAIGAGEHADHARHRFRPFRIDRNDPGVRMGRAHNNRVSLAVDIEIVGETALARNQPLDLPCAE